MTSRQRWWHLVTVLVVSVALVGQLVSSTSQGLPVLNFLSYFTVQSNLLVLAVAVLLVLDRGTDARWFRLLRLAAMTGITLTFLVFAVLIGPHLSLSGPDWWFDKGLHYASPLLAVTGLVLGPATRWRWSDLAFIAWPAAWLVYTLVRAEVAAPTYTMPDLSTAHVPYDFLDVERTGVAGLALAVVAITAALLLIASAYVASSRRRPGQAS